MADTTTQVRAEEVLGDALPPERTVTWERANGNADEIRACQTLEMAGPYTVARPWKIEDARGVRRNARLTPPLTIPEALFAAMLDRQEQAADANHPAWRMLLHTPPHTLWAWLGWRGRA